MQASCAEEDKRNGGTEAANDGRGSCSRQATATEGEQQHDWQRKSCWQPKVPPKASHHHRRTTTIAAEDDVRERRGLATRVTHSRHTLASHESRRESWRDSAAHESCLLFLHDSLRLICSSFVLLRSHSLREFDHRTTTGRVRPSPVPLTDTHADAATAAVPFAHMAPGAGTSCDPHTLSQTRPSLAPDDRFVSVLLLSSLICPLFPLESHTRTHFLSPFLTFATKNGLTSYQRFFGSGFCFDDEKLSLFLKSQQPLSLFACSLRVIVAHTSATTHHSCVGHIPQQLCLSCSRLSHEVRMWPSLDSQGHACMSALIQPFSCP